MWRCGSRDCPGHSERDHRCRTGVWRCRRTQPPCPTHSDPSHSCPPEAGQVWKCGARDCAGHSSRSHTCPENVGVWRCGRRRPPCPGHRDVGHQCRADSGNVHATGTRTPTSAPTSRVEANSSQCPAASLADLTVTVTRTHDRQPVAGADVTISGPESRNGATGPSGQVEFVGICPGSYAVEGTARNYSPASTAVGVQPATGNAASLTLTAQTELEVTVTDQDGNAIADVTVRIVGPQRHERQTGADGVARVRALDPGEYQLHVFKTNYSTANDSVTVAAGTTRKAIRLTAEGSLSGVVRDADTNNPIEGAVVRLRERSDLQSTTDASGAYRFPNLAPGTYNATASKADYSDGSGTAVLATGEARTLDLVLHPPALAITSVDPQFAPSVELLDITYRIFVHSSRAVRLQITSASYPGNVLFERDLTAPEKGDGDGKRLQWDGRCSVGALSGSFASPLYSPYEAKLVVDGVPKDAKPFKIEIDDIFMWADAPGDRIILNDPERDILTIATVFLKKKDGSGAATGVPMKVRFTFSDPGGNNTTKAAGFVYSAAKSLGKAADPAALFWKAQPECAATSTDGFKLQCDVEVLTAGADRGKAKVFHKPGAVGGDDCKLKGAVLATDGTTELKAKESTAVVVYRKVEFVGYEMTGQTHISTHGSDAKMAAYYTAATFVIYKLGTMHVLTGSSVGRYIGLWDHAASSFKDWATWQLKTAAETPTATETTDANGPASPAQVVAQAAVQAKANAWRDRIITAYQDALNHWASDASVPVNSAVAVEFEHPKYSADAPAADSTTAEWSAFAWLTIDVEGSVVHPDSRWIEGQGVSFGNRAYVMAGMSAARTEVAVAHEAGHETKNQFKRKVFGAGDHNAAAGLMDPTGSVSAFTATEIDILRGLA